MNDSLNNLSVIQIFIVLCLNFITGHWDNNSSNSVEAILRWQRGSEKSDQTFIYSLLTLIRKAKKKSKLFEAHVYFISFISFVSLVNSGHSGGIR